MRVYDDAENSREGGGDDCYRVGVMAWAEAGLSYSSSLFIYHTRVYFARTVLVLIIVLCRPERDLFLSFFAGGLFGCLG